MLNEEICRNAFQAIADGTVEIKGNSTYSPFEDELCIFEQLINEHFEKPKIVYLCDRRECKNCVVEYEHTSNIKHAKNFENIGGVMFELENNDKK